MCFEKQQLCSFHTHYSFVGVLASLALMMNRGKRMENKQPLDGRGRPKNTNEVQDEPTHPHPSRWMCGQVEECVPDDV